MAKKRTKDLTERQKARIQSPDKSRLYLAVRKAEGEEPEPKPNFRTKLIKSLASAVGVKLEKAQRGTIPRFIFETAPTILEPPHDQIALFDIFMRNWTTRQILRAIRQEVLGAGVEEDPWTIEPRFIKKCTHCGKEFQIDTEECDHCEALKESDETIEYSLREPDETERHRAEDLIRKPNPDYNFFSLLSSTISYYLALDDFYWSITYGYELELPKEPDGEPKLVKKARELYVEDSRFIRPIADSYGHLGNNEYFCPVCYDSKTDPHTVIDLQQILQNKIPKCPQCGGELIQTCWIQRVGGQIKARLGKDEIVHGSQERVLPDLYGNPKMLSLVKLAEMLAAMDEYNLGIYSEGKIGSLVAFPGMEQDQIDSMLLKAQRALEAREKEDLQSGKLIAKKKIRTVFLGVKEPPIRLPVMEDFEKMQSLEFYKLGVEKICATFGVTPVFVSIIESGKAGNNPRMQIDVQDHTTREGRRLFESVLNEQVFPLFEIHDWQFRFGAIQQRDDLRNAQIDLVKAQTAMTYKNAGFTVSLDEEGELQISGEAKPTVETPEAPSGPSGIPSMPTVSEASGDLLQRQDVARMPISWYDASKIEYEEHTYALTNEKEKLYLMLDDKRQETVWTTMQLGDALGSMLSYLFTDIQVKLMENEGFDRLSFESQWNNVVASYRRNLETGTQALLGFCQSLDNMGLKPLAQTLDEWRERISTLKPSTLEEVS